MFKNLTPKLAPKSLYSNIENSPRRSSRLAGRLLWLLGAAACLVLLTGATIAIRDWRANHLVNNRAAKAITQANRGISNGTPSTNPMTADSFASYSVPSKNPRYIYIPKIGVRAIVLSLGITATNQLQAPPNVYKTGWYNNSALPGQPGAMLIDGHVSSWTTHGVFYGLKALRAGDTVQVERGDGVTLTYKVVSSRIYKASGVDMAAALRPIDSTKNGLNLMTCTGTVTPGTSEFSNRIVVFTEQVPNKEGG